MKQNKIYLKKYTIEDFESWEEFVSTQALNSTFLHSRKFYLHNSNNLIDDCSLLFFKKQNLITVFPSNLYILNGKRILNSFLRATYGGFIISKHVGLLDALEIVDLTIDFAKSLHVDEIIIRNPFRIYNETLCDEIDFALWKKGFSIKSREVELVIDLQYEIKNIVNNFKTSTLNSLKKSLKKVEIRQSNDWEEFWHILTKNLNEKHNKDPLHSLNEFNNLKNTINSNEIILFAGYLKDKIICGIVVFLKDFMVIHAQYIALDYDYQSYRPLNCLIYKIIEWGIQNKYKYFNLGAVNDLEHLNKGLLRFKEGIWS